LTPAKPRLRTLLFFLMVSGGVLVFFAPFLPAEVFVDQRPRKPGRTATVASDLQPPPAKEIAREVLQLQQQMGGSIVRNRTGLQGWNQSPGPVTSEKSSPGNSHSPLIALKSTSPSPIHQVDALREAAWQLDRTAHHLEKLDLYDQADALRSVAGRLRRDARKRKPPAGKQKSPYPD